MGRLISFSVLTVIYKDFPLHYVVPSATFAIVSNF